MRVVREKEGGIVRRVVLLDESGAEVEMVTRFLSHLADSGYSPNTLCAYAYDLRCLASFLGELDMTWSEFRPSTALTFLAYLTTSSPSSRRVPAGCADGRGGGRAVRRIGVPR